MKLFIIALLANLIALSVHATTVSISGSSVLKSDGSTLLPSGSYTSVGYFNGGFSDFGGLTSRNWSEIITSGDYVEIFNSSLSSDGTTGGSGALNGILGNALYVWFFDITSAPTAVIDQEYGLFTGSSAEWTAKGDSFTDFNSLQVSTIDSAVHGTDLGTNVSLQAVPEPSAFALLAGAFGIAAVMVRRRR